MRTVQSPFQAAFRSILLASWGGCDFMLDTNNPSIGRFDKSFLVHMIRDFFAVLLAVSALEFALKAALVYYNYSVNGVSQAQIVADDLAENVRSIMRNEGGPVAARTIYPILERNWTDLGFAVAIAVAIVPSDVTIRSIGSLFDFVPAGIPEAWPEGQFKEASVQITAEAFCLQCHTEAKVGDVLGTVTVHIIFRAISRSVSRRCSLPQALQSARSSCIRSCCS